MSRLKPGQNIGTCQIEAFIAEGGMANVYKAEQTLMKKKVAVKVLRPEVTRDSAALAGFLKEGMAGARLTHPSIARVYYTAEENGLYYIVMDYVNGTDLKTMLKERGRVPSRKALEIIRQVAEVLYFSHDRGIVHRDIKPGNIMIAKTGEVILTDFGIASLLTEGSLQVKERETSGTPSYMSPEQFRGEVVDGRSDLYSLGATLFSLLSGGPPFKAANPVELGKKVLNDPPPPLRKLVQDIPKKVVKLTERLLAKSPDSRYQTARDVVLAVDQALTDKAPSRLVFPKLSEKFLWRKTFWWPVFISVIGLWVFSLLLYVILSWAAPSVPAEGQGTKVTPGVKPIGREVPQPDPVQEEPCPWEETLNGRIVAFGKAALAGRMVDALQHVDDKTREDSKLLSSLLDLNEALKTLPSARRGTHGIMSRTPRQVHSFILFGEPGTEKRIRIHLTWTCTPEGWFITPEQDTGRIRFQMER